MSPRLTGHERREQIIEAATSLFAQKGFRGTTTRQIAEAVGVSEAAVFKYFSSKEELYAAIIDSKSQMEELLASAMNAASAKDDAGVLRAVGLKMLEQTEKDPSLMRLLLFSALEGHELSAIFFESRVRRLHEFLSGYIAGRIRDGRFRSVDTLVVARAFIGMIVHYLLIHELFGVKRPPRSSPEEVVDTFVSIFLQGIEQ